MRRTIGLAALAAALALAGGCGSDDDDGAASSGTGTPAPATGSDGADSGWRGAQALYDTCVGRSTQYATVAAAEEACAVERENYERCLETGETDLGTPATPEECVPELFRP